MGRVEDQSETHRIFAAELHVLIGQQQRRVEGYSRRLKTERRGRNGGLPQGMQVPAVCREMAGRRP